MSPDLIVAKVMHLALVVLRASLCVRQLAYTEFVFVVTVADSMASQLALPGAENERCQGAQKTL